MTDKKNTSNTTTSDPGKKKTQTDPFAEYANEYRKAKPDSQEAKTSSEPRKKKKQKKAPNPSSIGNQVMVAVLLALALFVGLCFIVSDSMGKFGAFVAGFLPGLFGGAALLIPFLLFFHALYWKRDTAHSMRGVRFTFSFSLLFFLSILLHLFNISSGNIGVHGKLWELTKHFYEIGTQYIGGGAIGGLATAAGIRIIGMPGAYIFSILFTLISAILFIGLTPSSVWHSFVYCLMKIVERGRARRDATKARKAQQAQQKNTGHAVVPQKQTAQENKRHFKIDDSILDGSGVRDGSSSFAGEDGLVDFSHTPKKSEPVTGIKKEVKKTSPANPFGYGTEPGKDIKSGESVQNQSDFSTASETNREPVRQSAHASSASWADDGKNESLDKGVFSATEKEARENRHSQTSSTPPEVIILGGEEEDTSEPEKIFEQTSSEPEGKKYEFPPVDLLKKGSVTTQKGREDLESNAEKLITTLSNFNVHAKLVDISCGPTITRYEIALEAGTRVRALTNLVDDISLALATEGVRIEGVIPGKSAIGIEVPNKTSEFVYVRDLIDSAAFTDAKSRLTTALGKGVAGEPVFLDVAKMPHLLIAGTTGSGKSVCINSLLISILYKAKPDEVKLVLIDPKKVELNMYNGLPHLLVPVVFDPKKAAGALNWCVTEMERRFDLIEEVGAKNLETYTKAIQNDPTKERLPQIVIVIDELADLMMTAADAVETSVCRIAQKARAAGMHLIVGTQRPSVDVVTGLIKANIPSRIAFTVKSQVDSRTIIDIAGAEKLVGHGDMLYAPIGSMKPTRVQGAFVSESEIDAVIEFVKTHNTAEETYSGDIMEQIEKEAALCGQKKGKASFGGEEDTDDGMERSDPMLDAAIKLAIESGKISTSLIQRRLSLGFGRAAKLIDIMEERGIVSAPDGQKPRNVLISYEQYLEMSMSNPPREN